MKKALAIPLFALLAWYGYGAWLESRIPSVKITEVASLPPNRDQTLPFFELMVALPAEARLTPKLEYKKGPPSRYIERVTLVTSASQKGKERVIFHGRRTGTGLSRAVNSFASPSQYLVSAVLYSQGQGDYSPSFLVKPLVLRDVAEFLAGAQELYYQNQSGSPAFLIKRGNTHYHGVFLRKDSIFAVDFLADSEFSALEPVKIFQKSFVMEKREQALGFVAGELSEVKLQKGAAGKELARPSLLLAANLSLDPASLDSYLHFAGVSTMLYQKSEKAYDSEIFDILRNNVLSAERYAQDISSSARQTLEISRLSRLLKSNFLN